MPHLILENKNLILFLNLKFNFMKRRGLIFNSRPNKTAVFALGLMLGLCPVSKAWADTNMKDSQVVAQAQKKVKGQVVDATGEPLIGVNITVIGGTEGTITDIDGNTYAKTFSFWLDIKIILKTVTAFIQKENV